MIILGSNKHAILCFWLAQTNILAFFPWDNVSYFNLFSMGACLGFGLRSLLRN